MIAINRKLELEAVSFIILAAFAGTFFAMYNNNRPKARILSEIPIMQENQSVGIASVGSPLAKPASLPKTETASQISSDGGKELTMKTTYNQDNTQTYTFFTGDESLDQEQTVFSKTLDNTKSMLIPFNTWSPDNKYFFIQEQIKAKSDLAKDGSVTGVYAFKALGEPFTNEEKYLDVTDLFIKRNTGNNFTRATGWASETLIVINTTKPDNTKGPSYWFEVPGKAILQLSTEF